jgi:hypothetical protein
VPLILKVVGPRRKVQSRAESEERLRIKVPVLSPQSEVGDEGSIVVVPVGGFCGRGTRVC